MINYSKDDIETSIWTTIEESVEHGMIVSNLAFMVSKELNMDPQFCYDMAVAGVVHDVGKLKIGSFLLDKLDKLDNLENFMVVDEAHYIRIHPSMGYAILKERGFCDRILSAVLTHHENYDGSGYPGNLKGEEIPIEGRILHVCDCFGALISNRQFRKAFDLETAMEVMIDEIKNFDMKVYLAFQHLAFSREFKYMLSDFGIE